MKRYDWSDYPYEGMEENDRGDYVKFSDLPRWRSEEEKPKNGEQIMFVSKIDDYDIYPICGLYEAGFDEITLNCGVYEWEDVLRWCPLDEIMAVIK